MHDDLETQNPRAEDGLRHIAVVDDGDQVAVFILVFESVGTEIRSD